jgi:hypothetical protein
MMSYDPYQRKSIEVGKGDTSKGDDIVYAYPPFVKGVSKQSDSSVIL